MRLLAGHEVAHDLVAAGVHDVEFQGCYTDSLLEVVLHRYPPCFCTLMGRLDGYGRAGEGRDVTLLQKSRSGYSQ